MSVRECDVRRAERRCDWRCLLEPHPAIALPRVVGDSVDVAGRFPAGLCLYVPPLELPERHLHFVLWEFGLPALGRGRRRTKRTRARGLGHPCRTSPRRGSPRPRSGAFRNCSLPASGHTACLRDAVLGGSAGARGTPAVLRCHSESAGEVLKLLRPRAATHGKELVEPCGASAATSAMTGPPRWPWSWLLLRRHRGRWRPSTSAGWAACVAPREGQCPWLPHGSPAAAVG